MTALEVECEVISWTEKTVTVAFKKTCPLSFEAPLNACSPFAGLQTDQRRTKPTASLGTAAPRLWIVEDDDDDCVLLSDAFQRQNFLCEMKFFKDGAAFIDYLQDCDPSTELWRPALTLLDINMPRMGGIETLSRLRTDMRFRHLPVVCSPLRTENRIYRRRTRLALAPTSRSPRTRTITCASLTSSAAIGQRA